MSPLLIIRVDRGFRAIDVAAVAGVCLGTVRRIERMEMGVSIGAVIRVAFALGVAVTDLYPELAERTRRGIEIAKRRA